MREETIAAIKDWLHGKWEDIQFFWLHDHYFICTDEPTGLKGSERWYWHTEKCWCGRRQISLTNWCDGNDPK